MASPSLRRRYGLILSIAALIGLFAVGASTVAAQNETADTPITNGGEGSLEDVCAYLNRLGADDPVCHGEQIGPVDPPRPRGNSVSPAAALLSNLPLAFIENQGQTDAQVRFTVKGAGHSIFLTPDEVVFHARGRDSGNVVRLRFEGAQTPTVSGTDRLPGTANFIIGNDPDAWRTNVPTFGTVAYRGLYDGIDATYSGTTGVLKREFLVAAGADPSVIRMRYAGAERVTATADGGLAIETALGTLDETAPYAYQEIGGTEVPVEAGFATDANGAVWFDVGAYDRSLPLVIDPVIGYSTYLGGSGTDQGDYLFRDAANAYYVGGATASTDFPGTATGFQTANQGGTDVFVIKLTADGQTATFATYLGGTSTDTVNNGNGVKADATGVYVCGQTSSSNFPTSVGAHDTILGSSSSGTDQFVAKLGPAGNTLLYGSFVGGSGTDQGSTSGGGCDVNAAGNFLIATGFTTSSGQGVANNSAGWPTTAGSFNTTKAGLSGTSCAIAIIRPLNSGYLGDLVAGTYWGATSTTQCTDAAWVGGNALVSALNSDSTIDLPTSVGAAQASPTGGFDAHMGELSGALAFVGGSFAGGSSSDFPWAGVTSDRTMSGDTFSNNFPVSGGAFQGAFGGGTDGFVTRFNSAFTVFTYSTYLGSTGTDAPRGLFSNATGEAIVVGRTTSANFPLERAFQSTIAGNFDAFVTKFDTAGAALIFSSFLGGSALELGGNDAFESTIAGLPVVSVVGQTQSTNFPTQNPFQATRNGTQDATLTTLIQAPVLEGTSTLTNGGVELSCNAPGNFFDIAVTVENTGEACQTTAGPEYEATFPAGIVGVLGSCRFTQGSGTCVVSASGAEADFDICPGEIVAFTYRVRMAGGVPFGSEFCLDQQLLFDGLSQGFNGSTFELDPLCIIQDCPPSVDPNAALGRQVHIPIMNFQGQNDVCRTWLEVQNVGDEFSKAALVTWGEPGFCPPQCSGPLKVECSGLLKPGSTWNFLGAQIPSGSKSGILFSFTARQLSDINVDLGFDDIVADYLCETLFFNVVGDCDDYRRFKKAYNEGLEFAGVPLNRAIGGFLAVEVLRHCPGDETPGAEVSSKYAGIAGIDLGAYDPIFGGYAYYVPLLYAESSDFNSVMYIQNGGLECSSVEIWFKAQDDCLRARICEIFTLAPGETWQFDSNDCVGPDFQGNAWLRSSQPLGIAVDIFGRDVLMTYVGIPTELNYTFNPRDALFTTGNQVAYGPLIYSEYQGWDTGVQVQNMSSVTAAKIKVYFVDRSGDIITTLVDWICPRGSQTYFLPVVADLPGTWVGSLRVESQEWFSPGDPLVAPPNITGIVTLIKYTDAARSDTAEAIAYNLLTEQRAFDWQVGFAGGGLDSGIGLIAIPSVLKDTENTGVTAELAITNLVPKPGFTDFAIYVYDQNGLLDYVCQKLNEKQVEYISFDAWGYINPGFKGSAIISATFWEHDVFDGTGFFLRNLVGLAAVVVERTGTRLGEDIPGDEAAGTAGIPFRESDVEDEEFFFDFEGPVAPLCPGQPGNRLPPGEGPQFVCPPPEINGTMGTPDPDWPDTATWQVAGRIFRDGVPSQCTPPKACPAAFASGVVNYDAYYFDNPEGIETCVTVTLDTGSCGANVHAIAFTGEFPAGQTYACDPIAGVTYLGDVGSSTSQPFSFVIPEGVTRWTLLFHNNGAAAACTYGATISGFACQ